MIELTDEELAFLGAVLDLARSGDTAELTRLLDAGVPVNLTAPSGDSLLMLAAYHVHPDTVAALLTRGADTERVNDRGQTALAAAVFRRHAGIVTALLAAGADPHGGTTTPLATALMFELTDMQELLEVAR